MKEIKLTQGKFATVDDQDYDWLNKWKWFAHKSKKDKCYYAIRFVKINGKQCIIRMHRLILGLTDPKIKGDHEDGNGLNNQRHNLRWATHQQNMMNRSSYAGVSKHKGVSFHNRAKKWQANITKDKKQMYLGLFLTQDEAAAAYNEAAIKYYGEFARLNSVTD